MHVVALGIQVYVGLHVVWIRQVTDGAAGIGFQHCGPQQLLDVQRQVLHVALHVAFQLQGPFGQTAHVYAVIKPCHVLLAHLCIQRDVHLSGCYRVGYVEVHVGPRIDVGVGRLQGHAGQVDGFVVEADGTAELVDHQSAYILHRRMTHVHPGHRTGVE